MRPEQEYCMMFERMAELCEEQGWGDPFSYARSKEIYAACVLGHQLADTYSGADAINEKGEGCEYKSTIGPRCQGTYTGISVQSTWPEQDRYLYEEKLAKYPEHYYNRFEEGRMVESWKMKGTDVYAVLQPKLKKKFPDVLKKKDPRLSANITWTEIKKLGTPVELKQNDPKE